MRARVLVVVLVFPAIFGAGCRKTLAPPAGNQAPETWIVAAPQDTITTFDPITGDPIPPSIGTIPVRFHLYWAGSDHDGTVNGFFYAIVETTATAPVEGGTVPPLPGPKARDYRFTNRSDSMFVFTTSEELNTRQHAFFIYAVDDKGKPDPTPARFIFRAYDDYPPEAIIKEFRAEGTEYELLEGGGVRPIEVPRYVTDVFEVSNEHSAPRDTVAVNSRLYASWTGRPTIPSTVVRCFRYKLDEPDFSECTLDSSAEYNTTEANRLTPGAKVFTLYAVGGSGWRGVATRWFQMNFTPDTWFAGPDPNDPLAGWQTHTDRNGKRYWYKNLEATGWEQFPGVPGTMLSRDSLDLIPALRTERRTFFEMYNDILWLHHEGDTVHMNSWVMFPGGGFDRDSPYAVQVNPEGLEPEFIGSAVLTPGPANGSPIGLRIRIPVKNSLGQATAPTQTKTYPVYDRTSNFERRFVNGYQGMTTSGLAMTEIVAEDGNLGVDNRIQQRGGPGEIVTRTQDIFTSVEDCIANRKPRADCELRGKIITFHVNKAPRLQRELGAFHPKPNATIQRNSVTGAVTQDPVWNLLARDVDRFDPTQPLEVGGTPTYEEILERKLAIRGRHPGTGRDTCYFVTQEFPRAAPITFAIPPDLIQAGDITLRVRLCDCADCDVAAWDGICGTIPYPLREGSPNYGRCVTTDIPVRMVDVPAAADAVGEARATQRPATPTGPGRKW